jgi:hypothetical protein
MFPAMSDGDVGTVIDVVLGIGREMGLEQPIGLAQG